MPTNGWVRINGNGWYRWETFCTTVPPIGEASQWVFVQRPDCECTFPVETSLQVTFRNGNEDPGLTLSAVDVTYNNDTGFIFNNANVNFNIVPEVTGYGTGMDFTEIVNIGSTIDYADIGIDVTVDLYESIDGGPLTLVNTQLVSTGGSYGYTNTYPTATSVQILVDYLI